MPQSLPSSSPMDASPLRRVVLVRHGETLGSSSTRFHGSADVELSDQGRDQIRAATKRLATEFFDLVVASPLRRSWQSAAIAGGGSPIRLEAGFREVHFGRWEGLTAEEIQAQDPALYEQWQSKSPSFEFPGGEVRSDFVARVESGLARLEASGATTALVVVHMGVIRVIAEKLLGAPLEEGPDLGGVVSLSRDVAGRWHIGRTGSNPPGLEQAA